MADLVGAGEVCFLVLVWGWFLCLLGVAGCLCLWLLGCLVFFVVWVSGVFFRFFGVAGFGFLGMVNFWCVVVCGVGFDGCQPVKWCFIGCLFSVLLVVFKGVIYSGDGGDEVFSR